MHDFFQLECALQGVLILQMYHTANVNSELQILDKGLCAPFPTGQKNTKCLNIFQELISLLFCCMIQVCDVEAFLKMYNNTHFQVMLSDESKMSFLELRPERLHFCPDA